MIRTRQGNRPAETEGYRRKRRWAILLLCLCSALLVVGWMYDYFLAPYDRVVAVAAGPRLVVLAQPRRLSQEDEASYERRTKPEGKDWTDAERLYGSFLAATALDGDVLVFHEESATRIREGEPSQVEALDAEFFPSAAVPSPTAPGEAWVFGIRGTRRVAVARVAQGKWTALGEPHHTRAAKSGLKAAAAPWGAFVAWREPSEPSGPCIRVARREADRWFPLDERVEYIHGDTLFALCAAGEEAWLVYAAKRLEAKGELCFNARRLTRTGIGPEEGIPISDPLRVKREVLSIAVARFEGSMWLFAGRLGGVHVSRMKAEPERGMYPGLSDPGGRLSRTRSLAWTWIGALMAVSALLTATGVALLREKRYVEEAAEEPSVTPLPSATLTQRGVAFVVDSLLLAPFGFVFQAFVFHDARQVVDPSRIEYYLTSGFLFSILAFHLLAIVYYTLAEANFGQSVGKWVIGIEVLDASGRRITLRQAAIRNVVRLLDAGSACRGPGSRHDCRAAPGPRGGGERRRGKRGGRVSAETGGKMTLGQKVRMGLLIIVGAYAALLVVMNWPSAKVRLNPFGDPVDVPVTLVCLFSFGLGSAVTFVWVSYRTLRRKKEEPPSLPPAAPPAS